LPPTVVSEPENETVCQGNEAAFSVTADGTPPLGYQWSLNGTAISGATNASLIITNPQPAIGGSYSVIVGNSLGTVVSTPAVLTLVSVASLAPTNTNNTEISLVSSNATLQTWSLPVSTNAAVSNLEVAAASSPQLPAGTLPCCWSLDGQVTNVTFIPITVPGVYAVVCAAGTSAITNVYWVTQNGDVEQGCPATGSSLLGYWNFNGTNNALVDWWPGQGNTLDVVGTNNGIIDGNVTYASGSWGEAFDFPGFAYILVGTNTGNFGTNDFTIDFQMESTQVSLHDVSLISKGVPTWDDSAWFVGMNTDGTIFFEIAEDASGCDDVITSHRTVRNGIFHEVTISRCGLTLSLYIDGSLDTTTNTAAVANVQNAVNMILGWDQINDSFVGMMGQIKLATNGFWFDPWIGNDGQQPLAAYGLQNPVSPWGNALKVDTNAPANLSYRYMENNGSPDINCINGAVSLWFKPDWNGGRGPVYGGRLLEMGDISSAGGWWSFGVDANASNLLFETKFENLVVTYLTQPITDWSSNDWYQLVLDYSTNETSLYTNGVLAQIGLGIVIYPTISNRMEYGLSLGSSHDGTSQIQGTIDEVSTFDCPLTPEQIASGYPGTNANAAPSILIQPSSQTANEGDTDFFTVMAVGAFPLNYQWSFDGTNIVGATNSEYTILDVQGANSGSYTVVVANGSGCVTSIVATLEVQTCSSLVDGSFENGFSGWTHDQNVSVVAPGPGSLQPTDGSHYAIFNSGDASGTGGSMSQLVCVTPGQWYHVSLDYAALVQTGQTLSALAVQVWANNQCIFLARPNPTASWQTKTFQFQAPMDATQMTLSIFRYVPQSQMPQQGWSAYTSTIVDNITFNSETVSPSLPDLTLYDGDWGDYDFQVIDLSNSGGLITNAGASVTFSVVPGDKSWVQQYSYQWYKNGEQGSGQNYNFSIGPVSATDAGT
jgi:hypothetical protein